MSALQMFIPLTKVDAAKRLVYGVATAEAEDQAGEICDYATTKPLYEKWSQNIARSSSGKSLGNLRAMHGPVAAGKVTAITFNDEAKQIEICAKVVDDAEWTKVLEGVYTGFSQGGRYVKRWKDTDGRNRYTADPTEVSLVDLPCLPQATFEMVKADGTIETRSFGGDLATTARLTRLADELDWLQNSAHLGEFGKRYGSSAAGLLKPAAQVSHILRVLATDGAIKIADGASARPSPGTVADHPKTSSLGSRPIAKTMERPLTQQLHDTAFELDATCDAQKFAHAPLEKRFDKLAEALEDILRRVKNIEEQPLPLPFLGHPRAISKAEEAASGNAHAGSIETLLDNPETLSVLAIKLAQRNGRSQLR